MIRVDLPYPHKLLWPNGSRGNRHAVAREKKKHRTWGHDATMADPAWRTFEPGEGLVPIKITVSRKAAGVHPDRDNAVAAAKAYLDGISDRLGVNDRTFAAPVVENIAAITGRFVIEIGA